MQKILEMYFTMHLIWAFAQTRERELPGHSPKRGHLLPQENMHERKERDSPTFVWGISRK